MTEDLKSKPTGKAAVDDFPGDFAKLKLSIIRPALEDVGIKLRERGHEIAISEDASGRISIHIVPAGANKSIHPYDWFPTLSFIGAPFTKTVGLHGRNARRNSDSASGPRGDYKTSQVNKEVVEQELMKFVGEIANW
ncbi:MAG TPA: hypothetical protein VH881_09850 [Burkholderiales bacterium]|jgi:hypothetical protein